jgi:nucleoside-diphosphate-sugar epimerase
VDNESRSDKHCVDTRAEFIHGDICDLNSLRTICNGVTTVFHVAALSRVAPTLKDPISPVKDNVLGTLNVLEASRLEGVHQVIYSGSSTVYGSLRWEYRVRLQAMLLATTSRGQSSGTYISA